jgi:phosphoribosyl 1,2-cyclic phosphodiesterase
MLKVGPYPYPLKLRILSEVGHLSNEACGNMIMDILNSKIKKIMLGHLSKTNNFPELAVRTVLSILEMNGIKDGRDIDIDIALRDRVGRMQIIK